MLIDRDEWLLGALIMDKRLSRSHHHTPPDYTQATTVFLLDEYELFSRDSSRLQITEDVDTDKSMSLESQGGPDLTLLAGNGSTLPATNSSSWWFSHTGS